jgi:hypothetical protein
VILATTLLFAATNYYFKPNQKELGTYNSPEKAFAETQKALQLLSSNVNIGIESVRYINEFDNNNKNISK